ncbi:conserved hypothetical protein, secreted [Candidatus Magnetomorum sp. HK-1]|nr:conserved hypothetical protein, secreted [Candidatus Magnetomorum sp. HK-1]
MKKIFNCLFVLSIVNLFILHSDTSLATQEGGLILHLPFNGSAIDEIDNKNFGIVNGATLQYDRFNNANESYFFNGINNYISMNNSLLGAFSSNNSFSVSFWVKVYSIPNKDPWKLESALIEKFCNDINRGWFQWGIGITRSGNIQCRVGESMNGDTSIASQSKLSLNIWTYVVVEYDHTENLIKLYFNGIKENEAGNSYLGSEIKDSPLQIGRGRVAFSHKNGVVHGRYFNGAIDDIRIYNRLLSDSEIKSLYSENVAVSGCIKLKNDAIKDGSATLIQKNLTPNKTSLNITGCYQFYDINEDESFSVMIRKTKK